MSSIEQTARARRLRRKMTPAEQVLWEALRGRALGGLKFRRQHPIGPWFADFCCVAARLVVEVDGGIHDQSRQIAHDQNRNQAMASLGYRVIRFRNEEVMDALGEVLRRIEEAAG